MVNALESLRRGERGGTRAREEENEWNKKLKYAARKKLINIHINVLRKFYATYERAQKRTSWSGLIFFADIANIENCRFVGQTINIAVKDG